MLPVHHTHHKETCRASSACASWLEKYSNQSHHQPPNGIGGAGVLRYAEAYFRRTTSPKSDPFLDREVCLRGIDLYWHYTLITEPVLPENVINVQCSASCFHDAADQLTPQALLGLNLTTELSKTSLRNAAHPRLAIHGVEYKPSNRF